MRTESREPRSRGIYVGHRAPTEHFSSTSFHFQSARWQNINLEGSISNGIRDLCLIKLRALPLIAK